MSASTDEPPKRRTRKSKPKVRTGCITCKLRRVKCDEAKPSCLKCTKTGRKCDGYGMQGFAIAPHRGPSLGGPASTSAESTSLEYFYRHTAPQLSVFFGRSFWKQCVLHSSLTEPAIRQAAAAVGALHKAQVSATSSDHYQQTMSVALELYNRSIYSVTKKASDEPSALIPVVMGCIIFTCFEFLRADINTAAMHISSGMKLLLRQRQDEKTLGYSPFEISFLERELSPILTSFYLATSELTKLANQQQEPFQVFVTSPTDENGTPVLPNSFQSIQESRATLMDLIVVGHEMLAPTTTSAVSKHVRGPLTHRFDCMRSLLARWKEQFDRLFESSSQSWSSEEVDAAEFLRVIWYAAKATLSGCFSGTETGWDAMKADFEEMVSLSESLLRRPRPFSGEWDFSCEFGVLTPLYTVAWKCRYPHLRRRALELVLMSPQREIVFDSSLYHALYTRIMEVEEAEAGVSPGTIPDENWLPMEHARVHHFYGEPVVDGDRVIYNVKLLMKRQGSLSDWHEQVEQLDLGTLQNLPPSRRWPMGGDGNSGLPVLNLLWSRKK
ncbi:hypothetical protein GQ53DRAFT_845040 [Thozetella sp. PMI_491]|nr:hypothetical protein GQ53DRAFT_845040 [Thozetella sp. PMI_491]